MSNPEEEMRLVCKCGNELCRKSGMRFEPSQEREGQTDIIILEKKNMRAITPKPNLTLYLCSKCGDKVAIEKETGPKSHVFNTSIEIGNFESTKTIDYLRRRQRKQGRGGKKGGHFVFRGSSGTETRNTKNVFGRRSRGGFGGYGSRNRNKFLQSRRRFNQNRGQNRNNRRFFQFRGFFIKDDLGKLLLKLKKQSNLSTDSFEVLTKEHATFIPNVLNSERIHGLGKEEVMIILQILNVAFSKTISDPTAFIRNILLNTKFVREGLSTYIRSQYFISLYNIEILSKLLKLIIQYCPERALRSLPLSCYEEFIYPINPENQLVREIIDRKTRLSERFKKKKTKNEENGDEEEEEEEEERDWGYEYASIVPDRNDFVFGDEKVGKLPPKNVSNWKGISEKQYLSTHFKLIREDYIGAMKEGFRKWMDFSSGRTEDFDFRDMNVFTQVRFTRYQISKFGEYEMVCKFQLPSKTMRAKLRKRKFNTYVSSKALMRNSLIVLFREGAEVSEEEEEEKGEKKKDEARRRMFDPIVCLVVGNEQIKDQEVSLKPYDMKSFRKLKFDDRYLMIESPVFFTAYECVLKSLQEKQAVPFKDVIIDGDNQKNNPPEYVTLNPRLDFSKIKKANNDGVDPLNEEEESVIPNCITSWPETGRTLLNESENEGMRDVFRKRVSLIQGGPGTGKTFIGRKIAQVMNENQGNHPQPIVVICYTNHALDAFLEPMLEDFPRMVRIGTRTKSENPMYKRRQMKELMKPGNQYHNLFGGTGYRLQQKLRQNSRNIRNLSPMLKGLSKSRFQFRTWQSIIEKRMEIFEPLFDKIVEDFKDEFDPVEQKYFPDNIDDVILLDIWLCGKDKKREISIMREGIRKNLKKRTIKKMKKRQKERERKQRERERREKREREEEAKRRREEERRQEELRRAEESERNRIADLERKNRIIQEELEKKKKVKSSSIKEIVKETLKKSDEDVVKEEWRKKKREARKKLKLSKKQNVEKRELKKKKESTKFNSSKLQIPEEEEDDGEDGESVLDWGEEEDVEMDPSIMKKRKEHFVTFSRDLEDMVSNKKGSGAEKKKKEEKGEEEGEKVDEELGLISDEEEEEEEEEERGEKEEEEEEMSSSEEEQEEEEAVSETNTKLEEKTKSQEPVEKVIKKSEEPPEQAITEVKTLDVPTTDPEPVLVEEEEEEEENEGEEIEDEDEWDMVEDLKYIESKKNAADEEIDPLMIIQEKENERRREEEERAEVMNFLRVFSEEDEELFALEDEGANGPNALVFDDDNIPDYFNELSENVRQKLIESMPKNPWIIEGKGNRIEALKAMHAYFQKILTLEESKSFLKFRELFETRRKIKLEMELQILQKSDIVGLTSTMASIRRRLLKKLNAKIYIFEEAAELLEGQIIACIPKDVEHLILIGDHKQLKPKINMMRLRDCNIDVSLFERMDKIGVTPRSLLIQQRMRPEISYFMKHFFYPRMQDHESVEKYPNVVGHCMNVQFISHSMPESTSRGSRSKFNNYEAKLVVNHALFILKRRRYRPNQITIITPYKGQLFVIKDLLYKSRVRGLRVETVDDFQGEENEIILVSLVRSRTKFESSRETIGFLRIQNRIIVLMSRAKHGIYIYGNSSLLERRSGEWEKILNVLEEHDQLKEYLFIKCENHPENTAKIQKPNDFLEFKCDLECGFDYPTCHHKCKKKCHYPFPLDNHPKCEELVVHKFPKCSHEKTVRCGTNLEEQKCKQVIDLEFPKCGHFQKVRCFEKDEIKCERRVKIELPCGHFRMKKCHQEVSPEFLQLLSDRCKNKVEYVLDCGHKKVRRCNLKPEQMSEKDKRCHELCRTRLENCGHTCSGRCFECTENGMHRACRQKVVDECVKCGGRIERFCNEVAFCGNLCSVVLNCKHRCSNRCGSCNGNHSCSNMCKRKMVCGHQCSGNHGCGLSKCSKCSQPNIFICSHGYKMGKNCSGEYNFCKWMRFCEHGVADFVPCDVCERQSEYNYYRRGNVYFDRDLVGNRRYGCYTSRCENRCNHRRCTKKCYQMCNVQPCWQRCDKRLRCGHRCQGFCGESCPPCMWCQAQQSVQSRNERRWFCPISGIPFHPKRMKEDRIFILPCGCVFWSRYLDEQFLKVTSDVFKKCPNCRSLLSNFRCFRYEKSIKLSFYTMNNLNKIRRLEAEGNEHLSRHGHENQRIKMEKDRRIRTFLRPLARDGIVRRHFPGFRKFNFVEVIERAEVVMEEIVELEKFFFFETGIDVSEYLAGYLREISRSRVSLSVFICQVVNCMMLTKEEVDGSPDDRDSISRKRKKLEIETKIMKTLGYLKYLNEDYDVFYRYFHDGMGRRLLLNLSNVEDEKWLLSLFRKEFRHVFEKRNWIVNNPKLEQAEKMIADLTISKDLNRRFQQEEGAAGSIGGRFEVKVLSKCFWPGLHFKVTPKIRSSVFNSSKFEKFYERTFPKRKLEWWFNGFNSVKMLGRFVGGEQLIEVNGVQSTILELFNERNEWNWNDLKKEVGEEEDRKIVKFMNKISGSSSKWRVLKKSGQRVKLNTMLHVVSTMNEQEETTGRIEKVVLNEEYVPRRRRVDCRSPSMSNHEFVKFSQAQHLDRMEQIKAAVSRVLKKKKQINENEIYQFVVREVVLFKPEIRDIEKAVNVLITMEILERRQNRLIYTS